MDDFILLAALIVVFFIVLDFERTRLERQRAKVALRILVTGTRGKSTVARLVASILRESGRRVVAKTTGSRAVLILPDGAEREIRRFGLPTVLEQKKVLALAARLGADALVAEMMSIRPEYLAAESRAVFKPRVLLITNVRRDHLEEMGSTKAEIAESIAEAISPGSTVFVPEEEVFPAFEKAALARNAVLRLVSAAPEPPTHRASSPSPLSGDPPFIFSEDVRLALAAADFLGIDHEVTLRGIRRAGPDFGSLAVYRSASPLTGAAWHLVNAFAANEPESTSRALAFLEKRYPALPERRIALLSLREDRGQRTRQWLEAAAAGFFAGFSRLVFIGDSARTAVRPFRRRLTASIQVSAIESRRPEEIMRRLWKLERDEAEVVGLGNIVGVGRALVDYWMKISEGMA